MGILHNDNDDWLQVLERKQQRQRKRRRQVLFQKILLLALVFVTIGAAAYVTIETGKIHIPFLADKQTGQAGDAQGQEPSGGPGDVDEPDSVTDADTSTDTTDTQTSDTQISNTDSSTDSENSGLPAGSGQTQTNDAAGTLAGSGAQIYQYQENTRKLGNGIVSNYAVLVDAKNRTILAGKDEASRIVPASMTKVLTLLTAVEALGDTLDLEDKFKITIEITDYCYINECSVAGFDKNEKVTVRDLLYGTILPSGADAALGLAEYTAGSQEAFVELMNAKLEELGVSETAHFTNCVGIYDEEHYCTLLDMAAIMQAAYENELCREVLSARTYTTSKTKQHPDGILISNWFLRRIEDKDTGGEVACAKTGYVEQAGNCAVSYGVDEKNRTYICVTADAPGSWKCIYDHVKLYKRFAGRR